VSGPAHRSRAAILVAALLVFAAGGPALGQDLPPSGTLPSGVVYAVHADPGQPVAAVSLWYRAPAAGFEVRTPGISRLAAATVAASAAGAGTSLTQLVERWGGRVTVSAYPDSVAITALVPPDRAADAVRAMTGAYFAPVASTTGLRLAQRDVGEDALYRGLGPDAIEDALGAALFETGPMHDGMNGTLEGIAGMTLERVRAFAARAFRPSNAILVLTGNVGAAALRGVATRRGAALAAAPEPPAPQTPRAVSAPLQREGLIAGTGLGWAGPPIAAEADATAMDFLADVLFAPRTGRVPRALGNRKATVTGKFVTYHDPGVFLVTISGADAAAARPIVEQAIAELTKPMSPAAFEAARAAFVYRLLSDMATPADVAEIYGWYTVEGDAAYAPADAALQGRYWSLVAALTPASVAQTAAKYLGPAPAVVTLTKRTQQPKGTPT
jgi:zinc protease